MRVLPATLYPMLLAAALACGDVSTPEGEPASAPAAAGSGPLQSPPITTQRNETEEEAPLPATLPSNGGSSAQEERQDDAQALPPIEFCDAPAKLLVPSCGGGSCHSNPGATIGDFAADTKRAYNFVDKVSVRHPDCGLIIDSADYSNSFILRKMRGNFDSPHCGGIMPVGSFVVTKAQVDCLASWLQQFQR